MFLVLKYWCFCLILHGKRILPVFSLLSLSFSSLMKNSRTAKMMNREKQVHFVLNIVRLSGGAVHQFAVVCRNAKYTFIELSKSLKAIWITCKSCVVTKLPKNILVIMGVITLKKRFGLSEIIAPLLSNILKCFQRCWKHFNLNLLFFNL